MISRMPRYTFDLYSSPVRICIAARMKHPKSSFFLSSHRAAFTAALAAASVYTGAVGEKEIKG